MSNGLPHNRSMSPYGIPGEFLANITLLDHDTPKILYGVYIIAVSGPNQEFNFWVLTGPFPHLVTAEYGAPVLNNLTT